jgi:1,6-anhydro-N-acetylmuramate kinase
MGSGSGTCSTRAVARVDPVLLEHLLAHPFLQRAPPKATGGEEFGDSFAGALLTAYPEMPRDDLLATLAACAAEAVAIGLRRWCPTGEVPQKVLVSGGVHNRALMAALARALVPIPLRTIAAVGGHPDAKEALAFAVLGYTSRCTAEPATCPRSRESGTRCSWAASCPAAWATTCLRRSRPAGLSASQHHDGRG